MQLVCAVGLNAVIQCSTSFLRCNAVGLNAIGAVGLNGAVGFKVQFGFKNAVGLNAVGKTTNWSRMIIFE